MQPCWPVEAFNFETAKTVLDNQSNDSDYQSEKN